MHTGVNTGLVITGEVKREGGIHGVAGDAINVASRLSRPEKVCRGRVTSILPGGL